MGLAFGGIHLIIQWLGRALSENAWWILSNGNPAIRLPGYRDFGQGYSSTCQVAPDFGAPGAVKALSVGWIPLGRLYIGVGLQLTAIVICRQIVQFSDVYKG